MKKCHAALLILLLTAYARLCSGQNVTNALASDAEWGEGSILLNNGSELKGLIRYNDRTGIVSFESGAISKTLTGKSIAGFEYFDSRVAKQRVFYSLAAPDPVNGAETNLIFEVLRQYDDFAVLTKKDPLNVKIKNKATQNTFATANLTPLNPANKVLYKASIIASQMETIYFLNAKNPPQPYLEITHKEVDREILDRSVIKTHIVNRDLLKAVLSERFDTLKQHAKENKLDLDNPDDLLVLLDFIMGKK